MVTQSFFLFSNCLKRTLPLKLGARMYYIHIYNISLSIPIFLSMNVLEEETQSCSGHCIFISLIHSDPSYLTTRVDIFSLKNASCLCKQPQGTMFMPCDLMPQLQTSELKDFLTHLGPMQFSYLKILHWNCEPNQSIWVNLLYRGHIWSE